MPEAEAVQELLRDAFTRLIEHAEAVTDGLTGVLLQLVFIYP